MEGVGCGLYVRTERLDIKVINTSSPSTTIVAQKMDYSKLSLTQAKRLEMESQVKALELEKELEMERTRLAELRKVHYHLAGTSEGWEEVGTMMILGGRRWVL